MKKGGNLYKGIGADENHFQSYFEAIWFDGSTSSAVHIVQADV